MEIGERIKALRTAKGLTLYQLARRTGLQYTALKKIEEGQTDPRADTLFKIAKGIGVDASRFFADDPALRPPVVINIVSPFDQAQGLQPERGKQAFQPKFLATLPLFADAASLGTGREINELDIEAFLVVPKDQLPNGENCYCIKVTGGSMEPVFSSGDVVAIDFSQNFPTLLEGAYVACRLGEGEVTVKQLKNKPNHFHLRGVNPDWENSHGPLLVPKKDGVILGKVVWQWRKF